jgi:integrase
MPSLQKIKSKRQKSSGRGASAKYLWQKQIDLGDRRTTFRLGLLSQSSAEEISKHVDRLIESRKFKTGISEETKAWLQSAAPKLVKNLVKLGLCSESQNPTVADCIAAYISRKTVDWTSGTVSNYGQVETLLKEYFGDKRVAEVGTNETKAFWAWMRKDKSLAENTCRKHFQRCRQTFDDAIEQEVILRNPFRVSEIKVTVGVANKEYIDAADIQAVIDYLPADKTEWRLLFAFARYVGCRMPSEIAELAWNDIDWGANTILIRSPKTQRYEGRAQRKVPIFPEIQSLLLRHAEAVPPGTVFVFPTLRSHTNLSTTAKKYVEASGVGVWREFWNSLRASRETDLMDTHGIRRACAWIGNSPVIAMKHYALMKHTDYMDVGEAVSKSDAKSDAEHQRNAENGTEQNKRTQEKPGSSEEEHPRKDSNLGPTD